MKTAPIEMVTKAVEFGMGLVEEMIFLFSFANLEHRQDGSSSSSKVSRPMRQIWSIHDVQFCIDKSSSLALKSSTTSASILDAEKVVGSF